MQNNEDFFQRYH